MAEKRMFTKKVTDDDNFMALSSSAQALYLHLSMSADDDGFCNQVNLAMFKAHASVQDLEALLEKRYIYQFENGVIVIKHWRMANALRKDRYNPTVFRDELAKLQLKENGSYTWLPNGCQMVAERLPQYSIDKVSIDKNRLVESSIGEVSADEQTTAPTTTNYGDHNLITLSPTEYQGLINLYGEQTVNFTIGKMDNWLYENNRRYSNCYSKIIDWIEGDKKRESQQPRPSKSTFNNFDQRTDNDFDELAHNAAHAQKEAWKKRKGGNQ